MPAPGNIIKLVERFEYNLDDYRSGKYNETQVRHEFIDPFFIALGWDVNNEGGAAEAYKDVIHEDAIRVGGATKAPDYCFRYGGVRKFFLEAKKPAVNIKDDVHPPYQLRRYAWSAKLPLSILTDFEEFAVYDCRIIPNKNDKASTARIMYMTFRDYLTKWDEIAEIFTKEGIRKGSFDKYVESTKSKKGTAEVDSAFLKEIESWRYSLAHNIALRNSNLSQRELNFCTQRTIDRIIFLRICEARGIETENQLMVLLNGENIYRRLTEIFRKADDIYNSGLFHFRQEKGISEPPDELTLDLSIDDKVLKDIIKNLYYPDSPYEFSVLPADILGQVYEQFLGKIIRLTPGHHAKVEYKPEVKKAGGVYYTPTYIVDYIVENTVGELLKNKTPNQVAKMRILDPACGSGSFLIGAYQKLLDWHLKWYSENEPEKWAKGKNQKIYQYYNDEWKLTISERKRILLNSIYGVDIDRQAVEVSKLSLLLKVLEKENEQTVGNMMRLFRERALPNLADNIKCGNSLIGSDFYQGKQPDLFDEEEIYRINTFDWEVEFKEIMDSGGFDAVIGNPPYSSKQSLKTKMITTFFDLIEYKCDPFAFFIEQGAKKLKINGTLGFIVPVTWMTNFYYMKLRKWMIESQSLKRIVVIDGLVFKEANVDTCLIFLNKESVKSCQFEWIRTSPNNLNSTIEHRDYNLIKKEVRYDISPNLDADWLLIKYKIDKNSVRLDLLTKISLGMKLKSNKEFVNIQKDSEHTDQIYFGKDISRYGYLESVRFFNYSQATIVGGTKKESIHLAKPKILVQAIRNLKLKRRIIASLDDRGIYFIGTINGITLCCSEYDILYLMGLINSNLLNTYFARRFTTISLTSAFLGILPIRTIDFSNPEEKKQHDRMVSLVEQMLELNKKLHDAKTPEEQTALKRRIGSTDKQIDKLVYELYGLTDEEIKIVEESQTK